MQELKSVFLELCTPAEILMDNAPAFCSQTFLAFTDKCGIRMQYQCVYVSEGNGIAERCHIVKRIAVRLCCSIMEAVYWHNATPKDNKTLSSIPVNGIYQYELCMKGIDPKISSP